MKWVFPHLRFHIVVSSKIIPLYTFPPPVCTVFAAAAQPNYMSCLPQHWSQNRILPNRITLKSAYSPTPIAGRNATSSILQTAKTNGKTSPILYKSKHKLQNPIKTPLPLIPYFGVSTYFCQHYLRHPSNRILPYTHLA
jgi:hypothetical protein